MRAGRLAFAGVVAAALLVATSAASGGGAADPGVTPTSILLGATGPIAGDASAAAIARGAGAYFRYVNARGGVHGRTISYAVVDDGADPAIALEATRTLVEESGVFAIVGSVGTAQTLATRGYLNRLRVPQLLVASPATALGRDTARYPWTMGFPPSDSAEGWIYGRYLARTTPRARVAVLAQDDDDGRGLLAGLRRGLARSTGRVLAVEQVDASAPDVESAVASLKASGANVLALFVTPALAAEAYAAAAGLGWRPPVLGTAKLDASTMRLAAASGAVEGTVSIAFLKDPADARWARDPAIRLYRSILAKYARGASAADVSHVYGMAIAHATAELLRRAGPSPTRAGLRARARSLRSASNPFLLPGIVLRTGVKDGFPLEQAGLRRWTNGRWQALGGLWSAPSP